jgi:hypothetical protein
MSKTSWIFDVRPWILVLILQLPSIRNYFVSHSIHNPLLVYAIASILILVVGYVYFQNKRVQALSAPILASPITTILLLAITAAISYVLYPRLEGIGRGGTGDDAMVLPALAMFKGMGMYSVKLFDGAPISPGPGWIGLNAILVLAGIYGLFNTVYLGLASSLVWWKRPDWLPSMNAVLLFSLPSFAVIEQLYSRQDLLAIGCGFLVCVLLAEELLNLRNAVWIGILAGLIATSRIIFVAVPILIAVLYYKKNPPAFLRFGIAALLTTIVCHLAAYFTSAFYQPLHLILDRGPNRVGPILILIGGLVSLILLFFALRDPKTSPHRRITWTIVLLFTPLLFIAIGELLNGHFDLAQWEAARYLLPVLPLALFRVFLPQKKSAEPVPARQFAYPSQGDMDR